MSKENGRVRVQVDVHLGEPEAVEDALTAWSSEIDHLRRIGRENQADKVGAKLRKLEGFNF